MRIERIPREKINPALYNPRKDLQPGDPAYEKLKKSLKEFDCVEPLVWNENTGTLIGGHQRLKILDEEGEKAPWCSIVSLSLAKEKALNIALNNPSNQGNWDYPKLEELLGEIKLELEDIEITGFDDSEVEAMLQEVDIDSFFSDEPKGGKEPDLDTHKVVCPKCGHEFEA